ncbi:hypothetical protein EON79_00765 [bacterium]|nr:MAG: hypothetical protein EON79_00765 [bacterium]
MNFAHTKRTQLLFGRLLASIVGASLLLAWWGWLLSKLPTTYTFGPKMVGLASIIFVFAFYRDFARPKGIRNPLKLIDQGWDVTMRVMFVMAIVLVLRNISLEPISDMIVHGEAPTGFFKALGRYLLFSGMFSIFYMPITIPVLALFDRFRLPFKAEEGMMLV